MYDGNIVLLAFFLGMFFSLYAEQVIRSVVYAVVSFVMGLPTKHAPDEGAGWDCSSCGVTNYQLDVEICQNCLHPRG